MSVDGLVDWQTLTWVQPGHRLGGWAGGCHQTRLGFSQVPTLVLSWSVPPVMAVEFGDLLSGNVLKCVMIHTFTKFRSDQ